jgi:deoxyribonuclease V
MTSLRSPVALVDVHYLAEGARAACVLAKQCTDATPYDEWTVNVAQVATYRPGHFFERELPCLLQVLADARESIGLIVIDGYVVLDAAGTLGLGGHLFHHFTGQIPVIGIAKHSFVGSSFATRVFRGSSQNPLFVTALGVSAESAASCVQAMHGEHRIPTLCKRVDQLCRGLVSRARSGHPILPRSKQ